MLKQKNIFEIRKILVKRNWENESIVYFLSLIRQIIEEENVKDNFTYLNLYSNWALHTQITQSNTAFKILLYISDSIHASLIDPDNSLWINDAFVIGMSMHKLQQDFINFATRYEILELALFLDITQWSNFGVKLIDVLSEKPLRFPDKISNKKLKSMYNFIMSRAESNGGNEISGVIGVSFISESDSTFKNNKPGYEAPHMEIFTRHSVKNGYRFIAGMEFVTENQVNYKLNNLKNGSTLKLVGI